MHQMRATDRFRRLAMLALCALLLGSIGLPMATPGVIAQDGSAESIGDAPVADSVSLADETAPGEVALAAGSTIDPSSRQASRDFFLANYPLTIPPVNWTGSFSTCTPGVISDEHLQALLERIAYYRAMAGVPSEISLSAVYNERAQRAALMMGAAQQLSHFPQPGWPCYTPEGADASAKSNLHYRIWSGITLPVADAATAYMEEAGDNNANVGHRRWLLYPQTTTFGAGAVEGFHDGWDTHANAIWVMDGNYGAPRPATRDEFVAWPPPGYVPYQVTFPRWSFSYPGANFANATVTATKNGGIPVPVLVESRTALGYGENTIVWSMEGLNDAAKWPHPSFDTPYTITLNNVMIGGIASSFTYTVKIFDPATAGGDATLAPGRGTVGSTIAFLLAELPANTPVSIAWKRPTGAIDQIPGDFMTDANGQATGAIAVPSVPGGAGHQIIFTAGDASAVTWFEVAPRIKVTPALARRGETVDVSLRGFGRQETVRIRWRTPAGAWAQVATAVTSNSGSANVSVVVPEFAVDGAHAVRAEGVTLNAQTSGVQIQGEIIPPSASISPVRSTVNNWIIYAIADFPPNSTVSITWTRLSGGMIDLGSVQVDGNGAATGQFRVPATPGGPGQTITFGAGTIQATATFEVAARIKVNTNPGVRGEVVDVSLRGYGRQETVRIRWQNPAGQWIDLAHVVTSNTGSANVPVVVPAWAAEGLNSVRGDGTQFRQQTNAVQIVSPPVTPSEEPTPLPTESPTPEPESIATATPTEPPTPEPTETPVDPATPAPDNP